MQSEVLYSPNPIGLVGAGPAGRDLIDLMQRHCSTVAAADGGAATLLAAGIRPQAVIGDFDSLPGDILDALDPETLFRVAEQDSTDFEKALSRIAAPLIIGAGFIGARLDHQLAALSVLVGQGHRSCLLLSDHEIVFHCPPDLRLDLAADTLVSLFPLRPVSGRSEGLRWPIDGLDLVPGGRVGTSNRAVGGALRVIPGGPGLIVLLPRDALPQTVKALTRQGPDDAPWPAL